MFLAISFKIKISFHMFNDETQFFACKLKILYISISEQKLKIVTQISNGMNIYEFKFSKEPIWGFISQLIKSFFLFFYPLKMIWFNIHVANKIIDIPNQNQIWNFSRVLEDFQQNVLSNLYTFPTKSKINRYNWRLKRKKLWK